MTAATMRMAVPDDPTRDVPSEITLSQETMAHLLTDPALMAEVDAVSDAHGTAGLIAWLDERGLTWHAGGPDPLRAFGLTEDDLDGPLGRTLRVVQSDPAPGPATPEDRAAARRKAARKAQRQARKRTR